MFASLLLVALTAVGAPSGLEGVVTGGDKPVLVLRNTGSAACQFAPTPSGTVAITRVEQGGKAVEAIPMQATFTDGAAFSLQALEPGATAEIPLQVMEIGGVGRVLESLSWSETAGAHGLLYPVDAGAAMTIELTYSVPVAAEQGAPTCGPVTVTTSAQASPPLPADGLRMAAWIAGGAAIVVIALILLLILTRRRKSAAALALLVAVSPALWPATPARAYYDVEDGLQAAFDECMRLLREPGNDVADIFPKIDGDNYRIQIISPAPGSRTGTNVLVRPPSAIIYWDPNDRHRYHGTGGNADPCTTLYHELHHAWQGQQGIYSQQPCATPDPQGRTLERTEVLATKAQNILRARLGMPMRSHYGDVPLPPEGCNPPPRPDGCADERCANSNGDPHLLTFDHKRYDFQAVGEFVLTRSTAPPGFEVQVRQQPVPGSRVVAVNSAVAMTVGDDRVEVRMTPEGMQLFVGGEAKPIRDARLAGGGSIKASPRSIAVTWKDGPRAFVLPIGRFGLNISIEPKPFQAGKLEGLLGDFDGDSTNDIQARAGGAIAEPTHAALYPAFADSWRVTAQSSLFTYEGGTSAESFVDKTFPDPMPSLANRGAAEQLCRAHGVTVPEVLEGCIIDVALTGQADFAAAAGVGQLLGGGDDFGGSSWKVVIDQPGQPAGVEFAGTEGQKVFLDVPVTTLPNLCGITIHAPGDRPLATGCLIDGRGFVDTVALPATGTYKITVKAAGGQTGEARLRLIPVTDQEGEITPDGPEVVSKVDRPGVVSRFTFAGTAGQKVFVEIPGTTLRDQCGGFDLLDPAGRQLSTGCSIHGVGHIDAVVLPADGTYTLVVNPADRRTGETRLRLINAVDQRGTLGSSPVTVRLSQPGAAGYLTFSGTAGQQVTIDITDSTMPDQCGLAAIRGPGDTSVGSRGCVIGGKGSLTATLPSTGTYTFVLDPAATATGSAVARLR